MSVLGEELADRREETVRNDPYVVEASTILETARNHLLSAVVAGDVTESVRLMDVFARAALLKEETEDGIRVRLGLLTQDQAVSRAAARRTSPALAAIIPPRRRGLAGSGLFRRGVWDRPAGGRSGWPRYGVGEGHLQVIVGSTPT